MEGGKLDEELGRMSDIVDQIHPTRSCCATSRSPRPTSARAPRSPARSFARCSPDGSRCCSSPTCTTWPMASTPSGFDSALFLRAQREPDGRRTFKLLEGEPLPTSYGEDSYRRIFGDPETSRAGVESGP